MCDDDEAEDKKSLVLFLLGSVGYELEADRVTRVSRNVLCSDQMVEGISRFQFQPNLRTRLMHAAMVGNLARMNYIAALGSRVNMCTTDGHMAALHLASRGGHIECVLSLCERGASLNLQNADGATALFLAAQNGHRDIVQALTERGAAIELKCKDDSTPLMTACAHGHQQIIELLLEQGARIDSTNAEGASPLFLAAQSGHYAIVSLLCERGASLDLRTNNGITALYAAVYGNFLPIARLLCESGSNTLLKWNGRNMFFVAVQKYGIDSPMVKLLKEYPHH